MHRTPRHCLIHVRENSISKMIDHSDEKNVAFLPENWENGKRNLKNAHEGNKLPAYLGEEQGGDRRSPSAQMPKLLLPIMSIIKPLRWGR